MKIRAAYLLFVPLFLAGCGASTYESKAGLTPLAPPVVLVGSNLEDPAVKSACDPMLLFVSRPKTPEEIQQSIAAIPLATSLIQLFAGDTPLAFKAEYEKHNAYVERALVIYKSQIEAGDTNDSTGEVKKYLGYSRQCFANLQQISKTVAKTANATAPSAVTESTPATSSVAPQSDTPLIINTPAAIVPPAPANTTSSGSASTNASEEIKHYAQHMNVVFNLVESALAKTKDSLVTDNSVINMSIAELERAISLHTNYSAVPRQFLEVNTKMTQSLNTLLRAYVELRSANETKLPEKYDIAANTMEQGRKAVAANMIEMGEKLTAIGEGRAPM